MASHLYEPSGHSALFLGQFPSRRLAGSERIASRSAVDVDLSVEKVREILNAVAKAQFIPNPPSSRASAPWNLAKEETGHKGHRILKENIDKPISCTSCGKELGLTDKFEYFRFVHRFDMDSEYVNKKLDVFLCRDCMVRAIKFLLPLRKLNPLQEAKKPLHRYFAASRRTARTLTIARVSSLQYSSSPSRIHVYLGSGSSSIGRYASIASGPR